MELRFRVSYLNTREALSLVETKLDAHTALLNEHKTVLKEHTARFDHLETLLTQVLARLPEKP